MTKTLTALAAVATIAIAAVAVPQQAQARWGHGPGPFFGGLAAGAIIGGALAAPYYYRGYYGGPYGYYGGPYAYYGGPGPYAYYGGDCWRERAWTPYGWHWHRVCR